MSENAAWRLVAPRQLFESDVPGDWEGRCRRLAGGVYLGDDTVLCRTLARFKMFVSARDEGLAPHLITDGYWESWVTRAMVELVQPGMVCIDAGANVGYYTVLLSDLVGPQGKVVAAEPIPHTRRLLERNVAINGHGAVAQVMGVAFGAEAGEVTLYIPPGEPKNALICDTAPNPAWETHTVPLRRIDDLGLARVDFVKIDVEGAEMDVWHGMQETITANPQIQIVMEVNCRRYPAEAAAFLAEIEAQFPLRYVDYTGARTTITAEAVMAAVEDVMLYLGRVG